LLAAVAGDDVELGSDFEVGAHFLDLLTSHHTTQSAGHRVFQQTQLANATFSDVIFAEELEDAATGVEPNNLAFFALNILNLTIVKYMTYRHTRSQACQFASRS
jgi:hypothetical protein